MNGTVRHGADGSISWHAHNQVVLGPITFTANGLQIVVDAASVEDVLDFAASDAGALRDAGSGFVEPEVVEAIIAADDGAAMPGPALGAGFARLATVTAVDAIYLGNLDDGVLLLDVAVAHAFGGQAGADKQFALAAAIPDRIVEEITAADYSGPLIGRVVEAIVAAPNAVLAETERNDLLAVLADRADRTDATLQAFLADLSAMEPALAADLGHVEVSAAQLADLRALPPRLLLFTGPDEAEIHVQVTDQGMMDVSASLRSGVDTEALRADGIFAVAADVTTGDLLASSPATAENGRLRAKISLSGLESDSVRYAFLGSAADLSTMRLNPLGVAMTRIDRHCRHAWTQHRLAGALLASVGAGTDESEIRRIQAAAADARAVAAESVDTAGAIARQVVRRHHAAPQALALAGYRDGIETFADRIRREPAVDGATGPTLAEIYAVSIG